MYAYVLSVGGILVAAADYALETHFPLLPNVHKLARHLAIALHDLGAKITVPCETNMVFFDPSALGFSQKQMFEHASAKDLPIVLRGGTRMVLHHQTSPAAVETIIDLVRRMKEEFASQAVPLSTEDSAQSERFSQGLWDASAVKGQRGH